MAIHQNRKVRGAGVAMKGYIKESLLPNCMDLVIWGHEHDCRIIPECSDMVSFNKRNLLSIFRE